MMRGSGQERESLGYWVSLIVHLQGWKDHFIMDRIKTISPQRSTPPKTVGGSSRENRESMRYISYSWKDGRYFYCSLHRGLKPPAEKNHQTRRAGWFSRGNWQSVVCRRWMEYIRYKTYRTLPGDKACTRGPSILAFFLPHPLSHLRGMNSFGKKTKRN